MSQNAKHMLGRHPKMTPRDNLCGFKVGYSTGVNIKSDTENAGLETRQKPWPNGRFLFVPIMSETGHDESLQHSENVRIVIFSYGPFCVSSHYVQVRLGFYTTD